MKTKAILSIGAFILIVVMTSISGCSNQQNKNNFDISKNSALRDTVFNQILNNNNLFNGFMSRMMENNNAMNWMMGNEGMMQSVFSKDHLNYMMNHQSRSAYGMMENMMGVIKGDTTMMRQWQYMIKNNPEMQGMMMMHR
jgi:hypothetical protein